MSNRYVYHLGIVEEHSINGSVVDGVPFVRTSTPTPPRQPANRSSNIDFGGTSKMPGIDLNTSADDDIPHTGKDKNGRKLTRLASVLPRSTRQAAPPSQRDTVQSNPDRDHGSPTRISSEASVTTKDALPSQSQKSAVGLISRISTGESANEIEKARLHGLKTTSGLNEMLKRPLPDTDPSEMPYKRYKHRFENMNGKVSRFNPQKQAGRKDEFMARKDTAFDNNINLGFMSLDHRPEESDSLALTHTGIEATVSSKEFYTDKGQDSTLSFAKEISNERSATDQVQLPPTTPKPALLSPKSHISQFEASPPLNNPELDYLRLNLQKQEKELTKLRSEVEALTAQRDDAVKAKDQAIAVETKALEKVQIAMDVRKRALKKRDAELKNSSRMRQHNRDLDEISKETTALRNLTRILKVQTHQSIHNLEYARNMCIAAAGTTVSARPMLLAIRKGYEVEIQQQQAVNDQLAQQREDLEDKNDDLKRIIQRQRQIISDLGDDLTGKDDEIRFLRDLLDHEHGTPANNDNSTTITSMASELLETKAQVKQYQESEVFLRKAMTSMHKLANEEIVHAWKTAKRLPTVPAVSSTPQQFGGYLKEVERVQEGRRAVYSAGEKSVKEDGVAHEVEETKKNAQVEDRDERHRRRALVRGLDVDGSQEKEN